MAPTVIPRAALVLGSALASRSRRRLHDVAGRLRARSTLVRGNAPGEWRYWGADAWSTRYSPLDQINASNFNTLQVAWRWNASVDGEDEYYRTTPLYRERPAVHRGDDASLRLRDRSRRGHDAVVVEARGRHPLAEGAAPVRRPRSRLLDRRPRQRARRRRHARVPHGDPRREDGQGRSGGRQERRHRSAGRPRPAARAARGRRHRAVRDQRHAAGAQGEAGRNVGQGQGHRRRRHGRHRSGARPGRRQLPADHRRRRHRRRQLAHSRLLPDAAAESARAGSAASTSRPASSSGSST